MTRYDPRSYGVPSSGDSAADQAQIRDHIRSRALMDEGLCPNGCGPREPGMPEGDGTVLEGGSHCPACGFVCNVDVVGRG